MSFILFQSIGISGFCRYKKCPIQKFILLKNLDIFNSHIISILIVKISMKIVISRDDYNTKKKTILLHNIKQFFFKRIFLLIASTTISKYFTNLSSHYKSYLYSFHLYIYSPFSNIGNLIVPKPNFLLFFPNFSPPYIY